MVSSHPWSSSLQASLLWFPLPGISLYPPLHPTEDFCSLLKPFTPPNSALTVSSRQPLFLLHRRSRNPKQELLPPPYLETHHSPLCFLLSGSVEDVSIFLSGQPSVCASHGTRFLQTSPLLFLTSLLQVQLLPFSLYLAVVKETQVS